MPILCGYRARRRPPVDGLTKTAASRRPTIELVRGGITDSHSFARLTRRSRAATRVHAVRFYESRESLAKIVGKLLGEGFIAGLPAIVIATPQHRDASSTVLAAHYFDSRGWKPRTT